VWKGGGGKRGTPHLTEKEGEKEEPRRSGKIAEASSWKTIEEKRRERKRRRRARSTMM